MIPTTRVRSNCLRSRSRRTGNWVGKLMDLPVAERAVLATALLESLETESESVLSAEWAAEIDRRIHEVEAGEVSLRDAESVFRDAFASMS